MQIEPKARAQKYIKEIFIELKEEIANTIVGECSASL